MLLELCVVHLLLNEEYKIFYRANACNATHGSAIRKLSVCLSDCPSVCPSNAWIVIKRKQVLLTFLHHMKEYSS